MQRRAVSAMRARTCIPVWTFDESFYTTLLEGTKMVIKTDPLKGKGLFCARPIAGGEIVHEETALVCSQNMDDISSGVPVCDHCLRSLETPRRVVARVCHSKKTALDLPFGKLLAPETPVPCVFEDDGCSVQFCSARCRETAMNSYHAALCTGRMRGEGQREAFDAFFQYDWVQNGVDYSDTAIMTLKICGHALTRHRRHGTSLEASFAPFALLIKAPVDKFFFSYLLEESTGEEEGPVAAEGASDADLRAQYRHFHEVKEDPMSSTAVRAKYGPGERTKVAFIDETLQLARRLFALDDEEAAFLTPERWSGVMGAVLLNGQERSPPSYYSMLKEMAEAALVEEGGPEKFAEFEAEVQRRHTDVKVDDLHTSTLGQGIYAVGCLFNHSCQPNLQVVHTNNNDETLSVMSLRDITVGEELCISYIDEHMSFPARQRHLYEHYLFECACPKCSEQVNNFQ